MGLGGELIIPLEADHLAMTKFTDNADPAYQNVVRGILGTLGSEPTIAFDLSKFIA
jgi:hypothetical protein